MKIEKTREGAKLTVRPEGRLASDTADDLARMLEEEGVGALEALTIDMANVDFVSSRGIRVLVATQKQLPKDVVLTVSNANNAILEVLRLSGLNKVFTIEG